MGEWAAAVGCVVAALAQVATTISLVRELRRVTLDTAALTATWSDEIEAAFWRAEALEAHDG